MCATDPPMGDAVGIILFTWTTEQMNFDELNGEQHRYSVARVLCHAVYAVTIARALEQDIICRVWSWYGPDFFGYVITNGCWLVQ